jgi:hypothetical protein
LKVGFAVELATTAGEAAAGGTAVEGGVAFERVALPDAIPQIGRETAERGEHGDKPAVPVQIMCCFPHCEARNHGAYNTAFRVFLTVEETCAPKIEPEVFGRRLPETPCLHRRVNIFDAAGLSGVHIEKRVVIYLNILISFISYQILFKSNDNLY